MNYYKILEIKKKASLEEIKKAYRKLALKYHPDRNSAPDAEDQFKEISKAYQILSDPTKRFQYDSIGNFSNFNFVPAAELFKKIVTEIPSEIFKMGSMLFENSEQYPTLKKLATKLSNKYNLKDKTRDTYNFGVNLFSEYQQFNKRTSTPEPKKSQQYNKTQTNNSFNTSNKDEIQELEKIINLFEKPKSIEFNINVKIEDIYNKTIKHFPIERKRKCSICEHTDSILPCKECNNTKYIKKTKHFEICAHKKKLVFKNEGHQLENYCLPGDIIINLMPQDHIFFKIIEINNKDFLVYIKKITLVQFYKGGNFKFIHLDKSEINVSYNGRLFIQLNDTIHYMKVPNKGLNGDDLLIQFHITLPDTFDELNLKNTN